MSTTIKHDKRKANFSPCVRPHARDVVRAIMLKDGWLPLATGFPKVLPNGIAAVDTYWRPDPEAPREKLISRRVVRP